MNKVNLSLIVVFLSLIVLPIAFQVAYAQPSIASYVANDPDGGDAVFSNGDTITINTDVATNATVAVITEPLFVTANFTFAAPDPLDGLTFTTDWTAEWTTDSSLVITFINIGNVAVVSTTTVIVTGGNTIGDQTADDAGMTGAADTLSGDFGLKKKTGGDIAGIPPSYSTAFAENEYPISIGDTKFKREQLAFAVPTTVIETGKPVQVNVLVYDDFGPTYIAQVELYTNINGLFRDVSHSDTHIVYKKGSPTIISDPNGFFSVVVLNSSVVNQKLQLTYEITFAKEMEKSDIIVQATDWFNNVGILTVIDAWQIIQAPTVIETTETSTDEPTDGSVLGEIKIKSLNVEKTSYEKDEEILFFGTVDGYKFGTVVTITIHNPSNSFLTLISTFPDKDGYYEAKIKIDSKFKTDGTYTATAFVDDPNKGTQATFYFSREAPPSSPVKTSPVQAIKAEPTTTSEPETQSEPVTTKPKPRPSFVDPQKDPQSYVDRYNNEVSYNEWFDRNFPDYTIYEAVGLAQGIEPEGVICKEALVLIIKHNGSSLCVRLETAEKLEERGWGVMQKR